MRKIIITLSLIYSLIGQSNDAIITEPVVERKTKKRRKKTIIKVKYNGLWCVAKGTKRIEETGETIVDGGKGMSTIYEEKDYEVKIENV